MNFLILKIDLKAESEMSTFDKKKHWENIYETKALENVSWYQPKPLTSLDFIDRSVLLKSAKIIDVGGGDSFLVDHLLELGYTAVSVLDISEKALERAKARLGEKAEKVDFVVSDVTTLDTNQKFDFWHDRAAFHFLTEQVDIENYKRVVLKSIKPDGIMVIGTFSENGPTKCSGIPIKQYSIESLIKVFDKDFELVSTQNVDHETPFDTIQNFIFCCFRKR